MTRICLSESYLRRVINETLDEYLDNKMTDQVKIYRQQPWVEDGEVVRHQWMVHFNTPKVLLDIARRGFKYGTPNDNADGCARWNAYTDDEAMEDKAGSDFHNYAFLVSDLGCGDEYTESFLERGTAFLMFKANGWHFYHEYDGCEQVVFNHVDQGTMVLVKKIEGLWCVMRNAKLSDDKVYRTARRKMGDDKYAETLEKKDGESEVYGAGRDSIRRRELGGNGSLEDCNLKNVYSNILYSNRDIFAVMHWVEDNFEQYQKSINYKAAQTVWEVDTYKNAPTDDQGWHCV